MVNRSELACLFKGAFSPRIHSSVHPSTCQRLMRVTAIKAVQTSFSSVTWLPRDIVPPACPGLPHSLPLLRPYEEHEEAFRSNHSK